MSLHDSEEQHARGHTDHARRADHRESRRQAHRREQNVYAFGHRLMDEIHAVRHQPEASQRGERKKATQPTDAQAEQQQPAPDQPPQRQCQPRQMYYVQREHNRAAQAEQGEARPNPDGSAGCQLRGGDDAQHEFEQSPRAPLIKRAIGVL